jgi:hypothetical protein
MQQLTLTLFLSLPSSSFVFSSPSFSYVFEPSESIPRNRGFNAAGASIIFFTGWFVIYGGSMFQQKKGGFLK